MQLEHDDAESDRVNHGLVVIRLGETVLARCEKLQHNNNYYNRETMSEALVTAALEALKGMTEETDNPKTPADAVPTPEQAIPATTPATA